MILWFCAIMCLPRKSLLISGYWEEIYEFHNLKWKLNGKKEINVMFGIRREGGCSQLYKIWAEKANHVWRKNRQQ